MFSSLLMKKSLDIFFNFKERWKFFECWKFQRFSIDSLRFITLICSVLRRFVRSIDGRISPIDLDHFQHQNRDVRHRFLQRVLQKVSQFKISVLFLGLTIAVPNDDEDLITGKALKSVMERLYLLASKGSGSMRKKTSFWSIVFLRFLVETMQRLLPEKSISLMIYLHANNRSLIVQIDRDVIESIAKFDRRERKSWKTSLFFSVRWNGV